MGSATSIVINRGQKRKLLGSFLTLLLLISSCSLFFMTPVKAESGTIDFYMRISDNEIDAGDEFTLIVNINTSVNVNVSWYTISLLTYNETSLWLANATDNEIWFQNWTDTAQGSINNITGLIQNINASTISDIDQNNTAFLINFTAQDCGFLYFNMSGITAYENGTGFFTTINTYNTSLQIHPQKPQTFTATAINATAAQLNFIGGIGADTIYIERNSVPSWNLGNGSVIYNGTGTNHTDTTLSEDTPYYYQTWSWNNTYGLYSWHSSNDSVSTQSIFIFVSHKPPACFKASLILT